MAALRLTIFDDNADFRQSLVQMFRYTPEIEVAGVYPDCSRLQAALQESRPDVILMDIDMPGMDGIQATAKVREWAPTAQVVMLTVSEETERVFRALRNGATGYLLKRSSPEEIVDSVHSVFSGGSPMSPAIARKVLTYFHEPAGPAPVPGESAEFEPMTPREKEILEALVDGLSYKMIASRLSISADTVKNHIQGVYRKLHVNSKGEAISLVLKRGMGGKK